MPEDMNDDTQHHPTTATGPLTDIERMVIEFARINMRNDGRRDEAIRTLFGWSPTRYAQVEVALLDRPEALAYDAQTIRRLQRLREQRQERRRTGSKGMATRPDVRGLRPAAGLGLV
ncbi:DUF3263 domain-containing protein [Nocardioides sp. LHG3406-4]|uniref:DUF3263 domain-containing protein n=1 Tax=Nocardioides sp. LHG3406-4 TaxID=2804575 RepID=UPI003CF1A4FD